MRAARGPLPPVAAPSQSADNSQRALKQLIASIESWPAASAAYRSLAPQPKPAAASCSSFVAARPAPRLTTSLGSRPSMLSSMTSTVPQRTNEWRQKSVGPWLGPGVHSAPHVCESSMRTFRPQMKSPAFASKVKRPRGLGVNGRSRTIPDSYYAHNSNPTVSSTPTNGARSFHCLLDRFDGPEYMRSLSLQQRPPPPRRVSPYYHGAPVWDAPFEAYAPLLADDDHAYRLQRARDVAAVSPVMPPAPPLLLTPAERGAA